MTPSEIRPWKQLNTRLIYENPWITVHEDKVQLPVAAPQSTEL